MRVLVFDTAVMVVTASRIVSVFPDGTTNAMVFDGVSGPGQRAIARAHGYGDDWRRYTIDHDATHHFLADMRGERWSACLHDGDGARPLDQAPQEQRDEEHLVNRLLALVRLNEPDPYGQLERRFGRQLAAVVENLRGRLASV